MRRSPSPGFVLGLALVGFAWLRGCDDASSPHREPKWERCADCHLADYESAPRHVGAKPLACAVCHSQKAWHPQHLDHEWTLTGKHEKTDCFECHTGKPAKFEGTSKACSGCHEKDRKKADEKVARHDKFADTCDECHSTSAWKPVREHDEPKPPPTGTGGETPPPPPPPTASVTAAASAPPPPRPPPQVPPPKWRPPPPPPPPPPDVITGPSARPHR